jgi:hypothetical protein
MYFDHVGEKNIIKHLCINCTTPTCIVSMWQTMDGNNNAEKLNPSFNKHRKRLKILKLLAWRVNKSILFLA